MFKWQLRRRIRKIVGDAVKLKNKHTAERRAAVNYVCIFSQNESEHASLVLIAKKIGTALETTPTGPLYRIRLRTDAGLLQVLKIRLPDKTRTERGDADFTVRDYTEFKKRYLGKPGFRLIESKDYEMIELIDAAATVRAYFSNPPIDRQLGLI
ncbi:MAG: hypothetical protein WDN08_14880 [Rhizomicrobium sp.]